MKKIIFICLLILLFYSRCDKPQYDCAVCITIIEDGSKCGSVKIDTICGSRIGYTNCEIIE